MAWVAWAGNRRGRGQSSSVCMQGMRKCVVRVATSVGDDNDFSRLSHGQAKCQQGAAGPGVSVIDRVLPTMT
jgi:hypothetical protein